MELPFVRGDGAISGPWSCQEVLSIIQNSFARKTWDARFESAAVLECLSASDNLIHSVQKGKYPIVSARDLITVSSVIAKQQALDYVVTSVDEPTGPPAGSDGRVRAEIILAGWRLTQQAENILATYIVHVDPKGSIPSCIYV